MFLNDFGNIFLTKHLFLRNLTPMFPGKTCFYKILYQNLWILDVFGKGSYVFLLYQNVWILGVFTKGSLIFL